MIFLKALKPSPDFCNSKAVFSNNLNWTRRILLKVLIMTRSLALNIYGTILLRLWIL